VRLTALVESPEHVCCRYRLAAFRPFLEGAGHTLELRPWPRAWWSRLRLSRELHNADVVIVQRRLLPAWQLYLLRRASRRLLFDFDDAVFSRDSYAAKGLRSVNRRHRFGAMLKTVDGAIAGNSWLRDQATCWLKSERIHLIPTCVDVVRYPVAQQVRTEGVELVWVGSSSTLQGLERIRPLLERIGDQCAAVRLKLVCDRFLKLRHLPVIECPWSESREAQDIAAADIGVSWLPDDDWSRGKCGLKVLQYMAAGLPVVANPVGVQAELVRHGETGFLAETDSQWIDAIARLAGDPSLRRRMGQAGRRRVEEGYRVAAGARRWLELLAGLETRRQAA
jgi:glycosyltransferase involved in cell wall biosynthesis